MKILQDIRESSKRTPAKTAIEDAHGSVNYEEFVFFIEQMTKDFEQLGVSTGDRVSIYMDNNRYYIIAIFACLSIGAIWVPINHTLSIESAKIIIDDCSPSIVITNQEQSSNVDCIYDSRVARLFCETSSCDTSWLVKRSSTVPKVRLLSPGQQVNDVPAYIIYTSGTTGKPKGVTVSVEGLSNYVYETCKDLRFHDGTRTLSITPYYFDAPLGSIFCTLLTGGVLFIYPKLLYPRFVANKIIECGITYIGTTPGLFKILTDALKTNNHLDLKLEVVGVGGDIGSKTDLLEFKEMCPSVLIFNRYGPTETTSVASSHLITLQNLHDSSPIPIGKPLNGVTFHIVDNEGQLVTKSNHQGELYIGGRQVMLGYYNDVPLTNSVLRRDIVDDMIFYKTGDICSFNDNGEYIFHNRIVGFLKRNGVRTTLIEIELGLSRYANINFCICMTAPGTEYVVAFVILTKPKPIERNVLINELLMSNYPRHLIPSEFVQIKSLPYTPIGKIDRKALWALYTQDSFGESSPAHFSDGEGPAN
jgi:acyl-coenzyme A synthetase/AMP-(fatty) acid ligase